jgi:hypothetical protein
LVASVSQLSQSQAEKGIVELTQCPYDHAPIEAEAWSGGSVVLSCAACGAAWEWHGAWLRRIREPERDKVVESRAASRPAERAT